MGARAVSIVVALAACTTGCERASWGDTLVISEPSAGSATPGLQGPVSDVVALDDGTFVVAWAFNRGRVGAAFARFDVDARFVTPPIAIVRTPPTLEESLASLSLFARPDGNIALHWTTEAGELRFVAFTPTGEPIGEPRTLASDFLLAIRTIPRVLDHRGRSWLVLFRESGMTLRELDEVDGSATGEELGPFPDANRYSPEGILLEAEVQRARTVASPEGEDVVTAETLSREGNTWAETRELGRAEHLFGGAPFRAGRGWVELSTFEESWLTTLDEPSVHVDVTSSPNRGSVWLADEDGTGAIGVTFESDALYELGNRLVFRHVSLDGESPAVDDTVVVADHEASIEALQIARGHDALAITWVSSPLGVRRLSARVLR